MELGSGARRRGPTGATDGRGNRRWRRSFILCGAYLGLFPAAVLALAPPSIPLNGLYEAWALCAVAGSILVIVGLTLRPRPGAPDRPFFGKYPGGSSGPRRTEPPRRSP